MKAENIGVFWPLLRQAFYNAIGMIVIIIGSVTIASGVSVENIKLLQKVIPSATSAYDHFGAAIAVSGDVLAVGAPLDDSSWEDSGAVYIYMKTDDHWLLTKKLRAKRPQQYGLFGSAIAIEGLYLIVGEPGSLNDQKGYAHVFQRNSGGKNTWGWIRSLSRPDDCYLRDRDTFGSSLSVEDGNVLIGATKACKNRENWGETTGAAYLYGSYGSTFIKKLIAHNGEDFDYFGSSVSLCGQFAFVGAPSADSGALRTDSGAAYIFSAANNWGLYRYVNPQDTVDGDRFGSSISCYHNYAAIGAPAKSSTYGKDNEIGSVYIYNKNSGGKDNWGLNNKLNETDYINSDPDRNNLFGQTIGMYNNFLMVGFGESNKNDTETEPAAHIFKLEDGQWKLKKSISNTVESSCSTSSLDVGFIVATDGETFAIGDMEDETVLNNCNRGLGALTIYSRYIQDVKSLAPIFLLLKK